MGAAKKHGLAQWTHALQACEVAAGQHGRGGMRQMSKFIQGAQGVLVHLDVIDGRGKGGERAVKIRDHREVLGGGKGLDGGGKRHGFQPTYLIAEGNQFDRRRVYLVCNQL